MPRRKLGLLALALAVFASAPAGAQETPAPRLDPSLLEREQDVSRRERERLQKSRIDLPELARSRPAGSTKPLFKLKAVLITGATTIPSDEIAEVYQSYLGRTVSEADLSEIARLISELYREAGFHLSRAIIPPQDIKNGSIRISVIEGSISEVVLKGGTSRHAQELLQKVRAERPSRLATLERQLLLVNDVPGTRIVGSTLDELGEATGRFRLNVEIQTWRAYAALGLDNRGVVAIGPLQSHLSAAWNSYLLPGDAIGLNLSTIPDSPRELTFGQLWYDAPIGVSGARFALSGAYGEIWPSDARRATGTRTRSQSVEIRFTSAPLRTRKSSFWLTASAGIADISEGGYDTPLYSDRIPTIGFAADYQAEDSLGAWNYLRVSFRQGLDAFGSSDEGDPLLSRNGASSEFTKLAFEFARLHKLGENWSLRAAAAGQWGSSALLASQEFFIGGQVFGRGYEAGELGGDSGIAGSLELRFDHKLSGKFWKGYQLYTFIDGGAVRNLGPSEDRVASLVSAGGGIRFSFVDELEADFGVAIPVTYRSLANADQSPRFYFLVSKAFKFCPDQIQMRCS